MLENGKYPTHLKNRIRGGLGHISNHEALELFIHHRPPYLSHLLLSHLSKENNSPEMVKALFAPHANGTQIIVASRYEHSEVYTITSSNEFTKKTAMAFSKPSQLALFE
jgi:phosphoribosyl 1,2-cyclic phosphodiesterase